MNVFYTKDYSDLECRERLEQLYSGSMVVIPVSMNHARFMSYIAQTYIDSQHQQTFDAIKADYS